MHSFEIILKRKCSFSNIFTLFFGVSKLIVMSAVCLCM